MTEWWLTLTQEQQIIVATALASVLATLIIGALKRWYPQYPCTPETTKYLQAVILAFTLAALAAPGDWWQRLLAGAAAIIVSQGVYKNARGGSKVVAAWRQRQTLPE